MDISYTNSKIQKICINDKIAKKVLGSDDAKILKKRLEQMRDTESLDKLHHAAGEWHELTEDRKGQLACSLLGLNRLVFLPANDPCPVKLDGGLDWSKVTAAVNLEIVDYH